MASAQTSVSPPLSTDNLLSDERWQLVQRIISSPPFQKGTRLRDLLQYVTEQTIHRKAHELTEQHIGNALFHKPSDYSPLEDSSVRVHARQLRLKLHEYFNEEGRNEPLILDIPKGSYAPVFRTPLRAADLPAAIASVIPAAAWRRRGLVPWALCGILALLCAVLSYRVISHRTAAVVASKVPLSWPFSQVFDERHETIIVVADSNYGMARILAGQPISLDQYLRRDFLPSPAVNNVGQADSRLREYISDSSLTSFADVADVVSLFKMAGGLQSPVSVRYPRDLRMRDLDHNNYIFIGSAGSNPWVTLLQGKLNFHESETAVGKSAKVFVN